MKLTFLSIIGALCAAFAATANGNAPLKAVSLPLVFEANCGQASPEVQYLSRSAGGTVFITSDALVVTKGSSIFRSRIAGERKGHAVIPEHPLKSRIRYYRDGREIETEAYSSVRHKDIYKGVDLVYHGNARQIEYDFELEPGASPEIIRLAFDPQTRLSIDTKGNLIISGDNEAVVQHAPVAYQEIGRKRVNVQSGFRLMGPHEVSFQVADYDHSRKLVIDPTLAYSTYLGGTGGIDQINDIAIDGQGYIYVTGSTSSPNFPAVNSQQPFTGAGNAFVAKVTPDGSSLVYSTFFGQGDGGTDSGYGVVVDANGNAYFTGYLCQSNLLGTAHHAYLGKLNPDGSVAFFNSNLTGHPGDADEEPAEIRLDPKGNIAIVGTSMWDTIPDVNGYTGFAGFSNGFVIETDAGGYNILYSTYIGTRSTYGRGIAIDASGFIYVTETQPVSRHRQMRSSRIMPAMALTETMHMW